MGVEIVEAGPGDAAEIAEIHLAARAAAMPYLRVVHGRAGTHAWFASVVGRPAAAWWVAQVDGAVVGYAWVEGDALEHLYVAPAWWRRGIGLALLDQAKRVSPGRLVLSVFASNVAARRFYAAAGFRDVGATDGRNEEGEPDVQCECGAGSGAATSRGGR
jgi:GNAT superfamily N-acetyltransferase